MSFIWSTQPNIPPPVTIPTPGPTEVSTEVGVVANTVNAGGSLTYNTPNVGFDVVYEVARINVNVTTLTTGTFNHLTINLSANVSVATMNHATFASATINTAVIQTGSMANNPGSNLEIATKEYVDLAAANVPAGGSDLQNIIDAAGDLLVGIAPNTAARLPIGTDGQVLTTDPSTTTGLRWKNVGSSEASQSYTGLWLQTHYDRDLQNTQVVLRNADEIIMQDGTRTTDWGGEIADSTVSGAGGVDVGTVVPSQWYEIYAIRGFDTNTRSLLLHKSTNIIVDTSLTTTTNTERKLRTVTNPSTKIAQQFIAGNTGPLTSVEVELTATGSPTGLVWITVETDSGGFPSGTILANSRPLDVSRFPTDKARVRFVFDSNTSVTQGSTYHVVYQGDYASSDTNYTSLWGILAGGYSSGYASEFRSNISTWYRCVDVTGPDDLYFKIFVQNVARTSVTLPSGYDQLCLLGYVYVNSSGNFKHFIQKDKIITTYTSGDWKTFTSVTGKVEAVDLTSCIPPRVGIVTFSSFITGGTPSIHQPIGGVNSTDIGRLSTVTVAAGVSGSVTSNIRGAVSTTGPVASLYTPIVVEHQTVLARLQNTDCRLYVTKFSF